MKTIRAQYICERCGFQSGSKRDIFNCTRCENEICSNCSNEGLCNHCIMNLSKGLDVKAFVSEYFGGGK